MKKRTSKQVDAMCNYIKTFTDEIGSGMEGPLKKLCELVYQAAIMRAYELNRNPSKWIRYKEDFKRAVIYGVLKRRSGILSKHRTIQACALNRIPAATGHGYTKPYSHGKHATEHLVLLRIDPNDHENLYRRTMVRAKKFLRKRHYGKMTEDAKGAIEEGLQIWMDYEDTKKKVWYLCGAFNSESKNPFERPLDPKGIALSSFDKQGGPRFFGRGFSNPMMQDEARKRVIAFSKALGDYEQKTEESKTMARTPVTKENPQPEKPVKHPVTFGEFFESARKKECLYSALYQLGYEGYKKLEGRPDPLKRRAYLQNTSRVLSAMERMFIDNIEGSTALFTPFMNTTLEECVKECAPATADIKEKLALALDLMLRPVVEYKIKRKGGEAALVPQDAVKLLKWAILPFLVEYCASKDGLRGILDDPVYEERPKRNLRQDHKGYKRKVPEAQRKETEPEETEPAPESEHAEKLRVTIAAIQKAIGDAAQAADTDSVALLNVRLKQGLNMQKNYRQMLDEIEAYAK